MLKHYYILFILLLLDINVLQAQVSKSEALLDSLWSLEENPPVNELLVHLERLKSLSLEEGNKNTLAFSLNGQALMYFGLEEYGLYESVLEEFGEVAKDTLELGVSHYSNYLSSYSTLSKIKGDYKKSIQLGLQSIELENVIGENYEELAILYTNLASDYRQLGDYNNSIETAYKALEQYENEFKEEVGNELSFVKAYLQIAYGLMDLDKNYEALLWINKGIKLLAQSSADKDLEYYHFSTDLHLYRAEVFLRLEDYDKALKDLKKVEKFQESSNYRYYLLHELYGRYYNGVSDNEQALYHLDLALNDAKLEYSDNQQFPALPRIYRRIALLYAELSQMHEAMDNFQNGLRFFDSYLDEKWSNNPDVKISSSSSVGLELIISKASYANQLYIQQKDSMFLNITIESYRSAINLVDKMRLSYINEDSKFYIVGQAQSLYRDYIKFLMITRDLYSNEEWNDKVYNVIQRNKNSILVERVRNKMDVLSSGLPEELKKEEAQLRSDISFYSKLVSEVNGSTSSMDKLKEYESALFEAKENFAVFNSTLVEQYPEYYNFSNSPTHYYTIEEVQMSLSLNECVVEFFSTNMGYVSVVITKSEVEVRNIEDKSINDLCNQFIAGISLSPAISGQSVDDMNRSSMRLFDLLLKSNVIGSNIDQLYIIPDGKVSQIPFSSLIDANSNRYLIEEKSVTYLVSIEQLVNKSSQTQSLKSVLGYSPNFENHSKNLICNNTKLATLKFSNEELDFIESIYEGIYVRGEEASLSHFTENVGDYPIIHMATHACLNNTDPMLSEIFFIDGSLTNYDLQNMNINPELVVLAACNTAQGEIQTGEGVISLSRGFFEAGVKSLVSSLWSIDDYSSSEIVKGMYKNLKDGMSKSKSLHLSKLDYLNSADKLRSHPYYWAGLVHIGDNSPLFDSNKAPYLFLAIGVIMLMFIFKFIKEK